MRAGYVSLVFDYIYSKMNDNTHQHQDSISIVLGKDDSDQHLCCLVNDWGQLKSHMPSLEIVHGYEYHFEDKLLEEYEIQEKTGEEPCQISFAVLKKNSSITLDAPFITIPSTEDDSLQLLKLRWPHAYRE